MPTIPIPLVIIVSAAVVGLCALYGIISGLKRGGANDPGDPYDGVPLFTKINNGDDSINDAITASFEVCNFDE